MNIKSPPFWLVWCPTQREPRFKHDTQGDAEREAQRLAMSNPGLEFYVLAPVARVIRQETVTERYCLDEIPF